MTPARCCTQARHRMQGALGACLERSRRLTLRLFEKPLFRDSDYLLLYNRLATPLSPDQLAAFAALYAWRDKTARALDDAPHRVLPKWPLLALAQALPKSPRAVQRLAGRRAPHAQAASEEVCTRVLLMQHDVHAKTAEQTCNSAACVAACRPCCPVHANALLMRDGRSSQCKQATLQCRLSRSSKRHESRCPRTRRPSNPTPNSQPHPTLLALMRMSQTLATHLGLIQTPLLRCGTLLQLWLFCHPPVLLHLLRS
jgi:HRDC domain